MKRTRLIGAAVAFGLVLIAVVLFWVPTRNTKKVQSVEQSGDYTVTFMSGAGRVLKVENVASGQSATPPEDPGLLFGERFLAWDKPFTNVSEDLVIHAVTGSVTQDSNAFILENAYVQQGGDVIVPFLLGGNVCLSAFDVTVSYDREQFAFGGFSYEDGGLVSNCLEDEGIIRMNFVSTDNVLSDVDLCGIVFHHIGSADKSDISLMVNTIVAFDENDQPYTPEYAVYDATVNVLN